MASAAGNQQEVSYGGQAVIEGVMIRSPRYISVACRLADAQGLPGTDTPIDVHTEAVRSVFARYPLIKRLPLVRGIFALFEMLGLGLRSLERSANLQAAALAVIAPLLLTVEPEPADREASGALSSGAIAGTMAVSFVLGIGLFVLFPNWLAGAIGRWIGAETHGLVLNLIEGLIRLVLFVGYIGLIGLMPDIRRVFQYHGAEHKVVNGWEAGIEPNAEAVAEMSVIHPRCGTNFAFIVITLSLIVFSLLPWTKSILPRLGMRLLCLPVVAGLGFELIKLVGKYRDVAWVQALIIPGLWLQRLTTREPRRDMIEVALASFTAVRRAEETDVLISRQVPAGESL